MDIEEPDTTRLSSVDIQKLLSQFNPKDFARSLLPRSVTAELAKFNQDETTNYGEFLDNLDENLQLKNELPDILRDSEIENIRVWSKVAFKENKLEAFEDISSEIKVPDVISENKENTVDLTCEEISSCLKRGEVNTENVITNFLYDEFEFECSNSEEVCAINQLPLLKSGSSCFRFFYFDAFENLFGDYKTVHLFGKTYCPQTNNYSSCCVAVGPLKRKLFVLPRSELVSENSKVELLFTEEQILEEFYCVALKPLKITKFNFRFVLKRSLDYILGPEEVLFLEIEYSSQYPPVDQDIEGTSFCKVYGVNRNLFENFLLEKRIKGPCWLDVSTPKKAKIQRTWCPLEISCTPEEIYLTNKNLKLQLPPLSISSMYIRSLENVNEKSREIALISWAVCKNYDLSGKSHLNSERCYCVFVTPDKKNPLPEIYNTFKKTLVKRMNSERDLLNYFVEEFNKFDPDILVGYDFYNQELYNLVDRLVSLKIKDFSKLGRFRGTLEHTDVKAFLFSGRLICDMKIVARDLIFSKFQELETLYQKYLNISNEQRSSNISIVFSPDPKLLESVVFTTNEAIYLLKLACKSYVIPLVLKLSNICGTSLSQTFSSRVSKRSEFLLLHAFHEERFVLPDRNFKRFTNDNCDAELSGGLVLEPNVGFYENFILLMDFRSLYPSIIQEYNLCLSNNNIKQKSSPLGVIPSLMKQLTEERRRVQMAMNRFDKESIQYSRYNVYQSALKLSSNGIYGCLASRFFRFYCPSIAAEIVERARETLRNSVAILQNQGFQIIYGDTDSIMINTNSKDLAAVLNLGEQINGIINKKYSFIELRVDSIFQRLLIVGKKKYAGIAVHRSIQNVEELQYETIFKGLDVIRGDWPLYVCQVGKVAIDYILSDISIQDKVSKIKELLNQTKQALLNQRVPNQSLVITKYLTQDPENYISKSSSAHVQVALRCNQESFFHFRKGDAVSYIMCCNEDSYPSKRAIHLGELKRWPGWKVDAAYYLHEKVYPMVWRICSPLEGMGPEIEAILGTKYMAMKNDEKVQAVPKINKIEFERRDPFKFNCCECKKLNVIHVDQGSDKKLKLLTCQNPDCNFCPLKKTRYMKNQLVLSIRRYISKYYKYESSCKNRKCEYSSFRVPLNAMETRDNCPYCKKDSLKPIFSEIDLFLQLKYFRNIFHTQLSLSSEQWTTDVLNDLLKILDEYIKYSNFERVDLTQLFRNY